ncbi:glycosyltransferase [Pseudomonadota bacterium]
MLTQHRRRWDKNASIGLVGRDNDKGLGLLTAEYSKRLNVTKVLVKDCRTSRLRKLQCPKPFTRYVGNPDRAAAFWVRGFDTLFVLEFAVHPKLFRWARRRGIYSVLKVNYEFLPESLPELPDLFLCSSSLNMEMTPYENKVLIPDPVDTEAIGFRRRTRAITFVHNAGRFGTQFSNCTPEVLAAIPLVKNPNVRFVIRSQKDITFRVDDPRVRYEGAVADYRDLYREGDVFLMPQKFRATSLPVQEAMAAGMPVMTTDMKPFNEFCPFLLQPSSTEMLTGHPLRRPVLAHRVTPETIAEAIDRLAESEIEVQSRQAREYAESISWSALTTRIKAVLEGSRKG